MFGEKREALYVLGVERKCVFLEGTQAMPLVLLIRIE
jgi:hypothetical protein